MLIDVIHIIALFLSAFWSSLFLMIGLVCLFFSTQISHSLPQGLVHKFVTAPSSSGLTAFIYLRNFIFTILIVVMTFYPPLVLAGSPVAGLLPDGTTNTGVDRAPNGTPLLNIAAPNASGLSHNKFTDYNVSPENLVINNFKGSSSQMVGNSNLAGVVYANPNLANGSQARAILNEVTSDHASFINGYTEIFGGKADLILANPNGIAIAGAGFINTSRMAMVAGRPNLDGNGNVKDYTLGGANSNFDPNDYSNLAGKILITSRDVVGNNNNIIPLGLDASSANYADIIARTIKVTGNVFANNLTLQTANDKAVQDANGNFSVTSNSAIGRANGSNPTLAIDSSYLGGMYAGRISLIATEVGLGVKTRGDLIADFANVDLSAAGDVSYANIFSQNGDVFVATTNGGNLTSLDHNSIINAQNKFNLNIAGNIVNQGEISGADLAIKAAKLWR